MSWFLLVNLVQSDIPDHLRALSQQAKLNSHGLKFLDQKIKNTFTPGVYFEGDMEFSLVRPLSGPNSDLFEGYAVENDLIAVVPNEISYKNLINSPYAERPIFTVKEDQSLRVLKQVVCEDDGVIIFETEPINPFSVFSYIKIQQGTKCSPQFSGAKSSVSCSIPFSLNWDTEAGIFDPFQGRPIPHPIPFLNLPEIQFGAGCYLEIGLSASLEASLSNFEISLGLELKATFGLLFDFKAFSKELLNKYEMIDFSIPILEAFRYQIFGYKFEFGIKFNIKSGLENIVLELKNDLMYYKGYIAELSLSYNLNRYSQALNKPQFRFYESTNSGADITQQYLYFIDKLKLSIMPYVIGAIRCDVILGTWSTGLALGIKLEVPLNFEADQNKCVFPFLYGTAKKIWKFSVEFTGFSVFSYEIIPQFSKTIPLYEDKNPTTFCIIDSKTPFDISEFEEIVFDKEKAIFDSQQLEPLTYYNDNLNGKKKILLKLPVKGNNIKCEDNSRALIRITNGYPLVLHSESLSPEIYSISLGEKEKTKLPFEKINEIYYFVIPICCTSQSIKVDLCGFTLLNSKGSIMCDKNDYLEFDLNNYQEILYMGCVYNRQHSKSIQEIYHSGFTAITNSKEDPDLDLVSQNLYFARIGIDHNKAINTESSKTWIFQSLFEMKNEIMDINVNQFKALSGFVASASICIGQKIAAKVHRLISQTPVVKSIELTENYKNWNDVWKFTFQISEIPESGIFSFIGVCGNEQLSISQCFKGELFDPPLKIAFLEFTKPDGVLCLSSGNYFGSGVLGELASDVKEFFCSKKFNGSYILHKLSPNQDLTIQKILLDSGYIAFDFFFGNSPIPFSRNKFLLNQSNFFKAMNINIPEIDFKPWDLVLNDVFNRFKISEKYASQASQILDAGKHLLTDINADYITSFSLEDRVNEGPQKDNGHVPVIPPEYAPTSTNSTKKPSNAGLIVGVVFGCIALAAVIVIVAFVAFRKKQGSTTDDDALKVSF